MDKQINKLASLFTFIFKNFSSLSLLVLLSFCSEPKSSKTILLLAQKKNFGYYTGEILRTEGLNHFVLDSVAENVTLDYLANFDIVILTQFKMADQSVTALTEYVNKGGNLI